MEASLPEHFGRAITGVFNPAYQVQKHLSIELPDPSALPLHNRKPDCWFQGSSCPTTSQIAIDIPFTTPGNRPHPLQLCPTAGLRGQLISKTSQSPLESASCCSCIADPEGTCRLGFLADRAPSLSQGEGNVEAFSRRGKLQGIHGALAMGQVSHTMV